MLTKADRVAALEAVYASLPNIDCKRLCQDSCGPIGMSALEAERIGGLRKMRTIECPLLRHGRCTVYAVRPFICRLWGLVQKMPCPYGCIPDRWVTDEEADAALNRITEVGGEEVFMMPEIETIRAYLAKAI